MCTLPSKLLLSPGLGAEVFVVEERCSVPLELIEREARKRAGAAPSQSSATALLPAGSFS